MTISLIKALPFFWRLFLGKYRGDCRKGEILSYLFLRLNFNSFKRILSRILLNSALANLMVWKVI